MLPLRSLPLARFPSNPLLLENPCPPPCPRLGRSMMRCLYRELPIHRVTTHTNSSRTEDRFTRNYGVKCGDFARKPAAISMIHDVDRLSLGPAHAVLKAWLKSKVWARGNTFQWPDFKMTAAEITSATQKAHECWLEGYVLRLSSLQS